MNTVNHNKVVLALDHAGGDSFEQFSQAFMASIIGTSFIPLGGYHDGGADGVLLEELYEDKSSNQYFLQATIQEDHRSKIRSTVKRLRDFGRDPKKLIYITSRRISHIDAEEDMLIEELGVRVQIRDGNYIAKHINNSEQTIEAFNSYLAPHLHFLDTLGGGSIIHHSPKLPSRALCVFLGQEVERRRGNSELLESVTDGLILWSLEGTDPDKNQFMTKEDILEKIIKALPSAKSYISGSIDQRLKMLSQKNSANGREIRFYSKGKKYCLPYETRQLIHQENLIDEELKTSVSEIFRKRILENTNYDEKTNEDLLIEICHRTLELTFENQGLEIASHVCSETNENSLNLSISEYMEQVINETDLHNVKKTNVKELLIPILGQTFYNSTECERLYLGKLSRTYTLLFILKNEPKIVEYFRKMSSHFNLYIGADLVIRAISERYLKEEDQMTHNLFKILKRSGSKMILSENVLDEVLNHLIVSDLEYKNNYSKKADKLTHHIIRHIAFILIRAYFYARLNQDENISKPKNWKIFIEQFCSYRGLHKPEGKESLKRTLIEEFGFEFSEYEEMEKDIDSSMLEELTKEIMRAKKQHTRDKNRDEEKNEILARNDALHILKVFKKRSSRNETNKSNPFGFATWWLTQEVSVLKVDQKSITNKSDFYIIRPEFLLNFIALNPSMEDVQDSFKTVFPSLLGVKLSNRMRESAFEKVLEDIDIAYEISEARAKAKVSELSDKLKGDQFRKYEAELEKQSIRS